MMLAALVAVQFLDLTGPAGQHVEINPEQIVSLREPREDLAPGLKWPDKAKCIVTMTDGKFVAVTEPCSFIKEMIAGNK